MSMLYVTKSRFHGGERIYRGVISAEDIKRISEAMDAKVADVMRYVAIGMFKELVEMSPVDTGRFRASWNFSIGQPGSEEHPEILKNSARSGYLSREEASQISLGRMDENSAKIDGRSSVFLTNIIKYARLLEEGSSRQAPQGMVSVVVPKWANLFKSGSP